jgi:hypothetical protein
LKTDYYGVTRAQMRDYLSKVGATETSEGWFDGQGWSAAISPAPWKQIGSLRVGGTTVEFSGDEEAINAMLPRLHQMTMRGGG